MSLTFPVSRPAGKPPRPSFETSVFLNCPFDDAYKPIFQALAFAVYDCGWVPRCALEESDSGEVRFQKIIRLLKSCRYSIHDISRTTLEAGTNLPRFNMPMELGVELGLRNSGHPKWRTKRCLVLDAERYRYQKFLSDIAGQDIRGHSDSPLEAIRQVRDWLSTVSRRSSIPGGNIIARRYDLFSSALRPMAEAENLEVENLTYRDYAHFIEQWLKTNAPARSPVGAATS